MSVAERKFYRGHMLQLCVAELDELANNSENKPFTIFLLLIENWQVLVTAHGHLKVSSMLEKFCLELQAAVGKAIVYRISDNQIVVTSAGINAAANQKLYEKLKTLTHELGAKTLGNEASHIYCLNAFYEVSRPEDAGEILSNLFTSALNPAAIEAISNNKSETKVLLGLANEIYDALAKHRLKLAFQPIIEAKGGTISHYECLLRIVDDKGNVGSAGSFIHIAEKMGIIEAIDLRVLDLVFRKLDEDKNIHLAFNISNYTIFSETWLKQFFEYITPAKAKRLIIEITETAVMHDLAKVAMFIARVQETGCQVALDDFGSGYTSFRQIQSLSLDYVKIDGSLIKGISNNRHNKILVASLLEFLKSLNLKTVAEFVDGGDTAKFLIESGIDYMQGHYFGAAE